MKHNKTIIIDYDDTFTLEPELFQRMIYQFKAKGYKIICVTMRYEHIKDESDEVNMLCPAVFDKVVFTGRKAKMKFINEMNLNPAIYIDDNPAALFLDAKESYGEVV